MVILIVARKCMVEMLSLIDEAVKVDRRLGGLIASLFDILSDLGSATSRVSLTPLVAAQLSTVLQQSMRAQIAATNICPFSLAALLSLEHYRLHLHILLDPPPQHPAFLCQTFYSGSEFSLFGATSSEH